MGKGRPKVPSKPGGLSSELVITELRLQNTFPFAQVDNVITQSSKTSSNNVIDWRPFRSFFRKLKEPGDPREILERLLFGLVEILNAQRGYVLLSEGAGTELTTVASYQLEDADTFVFC